MRLARILMGMIVGAAIGGAVALVLAPQSGEDTRQMIQDRAQAILEEGQQAAEARRLELTEQFEALKRPE